jgi:hypothetical protein
VGDADGINVGVSVVAGKGVGVEGRREAGNVMEGRNVEVGEGRGRWRSKSGEQPANRNPRIRERDHFMVKVPLF